MSTLQPLSLPANVDPSWTVGIVASLWHRDILEPMINRAKETLVEAGLQPENVQLFDAPGSFEIPLIGAALMEKFDALMGFGIVLQGDTMHAQLIAQTTAQAMMDLQIEHQKPFAFEILHVNNLEDARKRAEGPYNKGFEAARAVLLSLVTLKNVRG